MAEARHLQGRLDEARALYSAAVATWEQQLGPLNAKTLASRHKRGRFLLAVGDLPDAQRELRTVIAGYEEAFAPDHPQLHAARVDLADGLLREGNFQAAYTLLQEAAPVLEATYGAEFDLCVRTRALLARAGSGAADR